MNRKRAILIAVLSTAALSLLAGCGNAKKEANNTDKANADTVKIAVAGPMTGDNSEYGIGFANAAEMKAEESGPELQRIRRISVIGAIDGLRSIGYSA